MPIELSELDGGKTIEVRAAGRLTPTDYDRFVPAVEKLMEGHKKVRILFEMQDFHGWDAGAAWDDFKFGLRHATDVDRLAMVGDHKWEKWMATLCKAFTTGQVRYFDQSQSAQARDWLRA